jgi:hypothetical protein
VAQVVAELEEIKKNPTYENSEDIYSFHWTSDADLKVEVELPI